ncbi:MAG TPA: hypothetical protein PKK06_06945 [Phycisphaerae bacterium]|nr:hypothetical protein [Phycisphaerae bacterium]HNU46904.1 hypothetical protein [Phycisphaerae bacterium]
MNTTTAALKQFLADTGAGNPGSTASPTAVVRLFAEYLSGWAHEDLNPFERQRFEQEYEEGRRFCDIFDATRVQPHHLNAMLGHYGVHHGPGTKGFLRRVGPVMEKLASWLVEKDFWAAKDYAWYRELVGEKPGRDLVGCDEFAQLLWQHAEAHPVHVPDDLPDDDYFDDQFTIRKVEPGTLYLDAFLEGGEDIEIALPKALTAKARAGWSVNLELARVRGKWRILGVGSAYP